MFFSFFTLTHGAFSAAAVAAAAADQLAAGELQQENLEKRRGKRVANEARLSVQAYFLFLVQFFFVLLCFVFAKRSHHGTRFLVSSGFVVPCIK